MAEKITSEKLLEEVANLLAEPQEQKVEQQKLKVGVDLGTSSLVLVVLTEDDRPLVCLSEEAKVVRDGLVVDFFAATQIVKRLKQQAETLLGVELKIASGAIPPQTGVSSTNAVAHVIEAAEMDCYQVFDEPYAAAKVLQVTDGAVVDIGGGTTGISVFKTGEVVYAEDEATGGHHMTLVLSGHHRVSYDETEVIKRDTTRYQETFQIIQPVVEKMAFITRQFLQRYGEPIPQIYVVGGATMFPQFKAVFEASIGIPVVQPIFPRLVTPIGIAMLSRSF